MFERAEYRNLDLDLDVSFGYHKLKNIPRTCFGTPDFTTEQERDRVIKEQLE